MSWSGRSRSFLRLLVTAALTIYILRKCDLRAIAALLSLANLPLILATVALVAVDRTLMAYRWIVLLRATGARVDLRTTFRIFFVSTFVGTFLPASIGSDAVRAYSLARERVSSADSIASVLMDRALGVLSLVALAGLMIAAAWHRIHDSRTLVAMTVITAGLAAGALAAFSTRGNRWCARVVRMVGASRLAEHVEGLGCAFRRYRLARSAVALVFGYSIGVQILRILQAWLIGLALGISGHLVDYFLFIPVILLVMLLPITVNGLGTSQVAFVWFFGRAGVQASAAFALSVLFVALGILGNLPGGFLYASGGLRGASRDLVMPEPKPAQNGPGPAM